MPFPAVVVTILTLMLNKHRRNLKREQRALAGADKIRAAIETALGSPANQEDINQYLLKNAEVYELVANLDASSMCSPEMTDGSQRVLAYEWSFLESKDQLDLALDISRGLRNHLQNGELSTKIEDYV